MIPVFTDDFIFNPSERNLIPCDTDILRTIFLNVFFENQSFF